MSLTTYIRDNKIKAEIVHLDTPLPTTKHIARYLGIKPSQIIMTQLLQGENKRLVLCLYPSGKMLDFKKVEKITGIRRLRYADNEVAIKTTGFPSNSIPPVGFTVSCPVLADNTILDNEECFGVGGEDMQLIKIDSQDIISECGGEKVDIVNS